MANYLCSPETAIGIDAEIDRLKKEIEKLRVREALAVGDNIVHIEKLEAEIKRRGECMEYLFEHVTAFSLDHYDVAKLFDADGKVKPWRGSDD